MTEFIYATTPCEIIRSQTKNINPLSLLLVFKVIKTYRPTISLESPAT
jgi:hypothetical protein